MNKYYKHILAAAAGLICLIVYIVTLNPTVTFMDSGELAAACTIFGIPHPTGYPLFLILGYIFTKLPISSSPVYNLNVMSAIISSAAVVVFFYASFLLISNIKTAPEKVSVKQRKDKHTKSKNAKDKSEKEIYTFSENIILITSFFTALVFGFSKTFWENALSVEVYPLHGLFLILLIYFCLKIYFGLKEHIKKYWIILFIILGFSFANHMTTVFVIPGILLLYYFQYRDGPVFAKSVTKYIFLIIPGLLLYLVLMIRASEGPYINWSEPDTFSNLLYHITGGDYSQLMFSSSSVFSNNLKLFFSTIMGEYAIVPGIISLIGLIFLYRQNKAVFYFFVILILSCFIYSLNYNIRDLLSYFLLVYISLGFMFGIGFIFSLYKLLTSQKNFTLAAVIAGVILSGFSLGYNFKANDESSEFVVEDITVNTLNELEPNSVLFTYDWGYVYPASIYYQQAQKLRGDVKVFNIKFLAAPWYLDMIKKYYPDVYSGCSTEIREYSDFYKNNGPNAQRLINLVKAFINSCYRKFPAYMTFDFAYSREIRPIISGYLIQPAGLVYKLAAKNSQYDSTSGINSLQAVFRKYSPDTQEKEKMNISTAGVYYDCGEYHAKHKNYSLAMKFLNKALEIRSNFIEAVNLKNQILKVTR